MPDSTLGYYLCRWGLSARRPGKIIYKQSPKAIEQRVDRFLSDIKARAAIENAEIYFGGEAKNNMLSAVSNRGKLHFLIYENGIGADQFIDFMERLIGGAKKKVFYIIIQNVRKYQNEKVTTWLKKHRDTIEIINMPSNNSNNNL